VTSDTIAAWVASELGIDLLILGIIFIMVAFGASFGYTVMARISLLIGRFYFLLHDWLPIIR
jgi:hypothetical protein